MNPFKTGDIAIFMYPQQNDEHMTLYKEYVVLSSSDECILITTDINRHINKYATKFKLKTHVPCLPDELFTL